MDFAGPPGAGEHMKQPDYRLPSLWVCLITSVCASASMQDIQELETRIRDGFAACSERRYQDARQHLEPILQSSVLRAGDPRRVLATEVLAISDQALGDTATATRLHLSVLSD